MDDNPLSSDEESKIDHMNAESGAAPFDATQRREFLGGGGSPDAPTFTFKPEAATRPTTISELLGQRDEQLSQINESHRQGFRDLTTAYARDLAKATPANVTDTLKLMQYEVPIRLKITTLAIEEQVQNASHMATAFLTERDAASFDGPLQEALKWGINSRKVKELVKNADSPLTIRAALDETTLTTAIDIAAKHGRTHPHIERYLDMASTETVKQAMRAALDDLAFHDAQDLAQKYSARHPAINKNEDAASSPAVRRAMAGALDGEVMRGLSDLVHEAGVDHPRVTAYLAGLSNERVRQLIADRLHIPDSMRPRKPESNSKTAQTPPPTPNAQDNDPRPETGASTSSTRSDTNSSASTTPRFTTSTGFSDFVSGLFSEGGLFNSGNMSARNANRPRPSTGQEPTTPPDQREAKPIPKSPDIHDIKSKIIDQVDAAAADFRKQGLSDDRLHKALVRRFHPESVHSEGEAGGSADHMRVVTKKYKKA